MALTKESMANFIDAAMNSVDSTQIVGNDGDPEGRARNYLEALCQGIIDEITANGNAVGSDSRGDSHNLTIV